MPLKCLILHVPAACAERVSDALMEAGAQSVTVEDADAGTPAERALYAEPGADAEVGIRSGEHWALCAVHALLADAADERPFVEVAARAVESAGDAGAEGGATARYPSGLPYRVDVVGDQDWVRASQAQFEPIEAAPGIWIVPSWREPPVPGALNIRIDPGLAFGTGAHATTQLCLRWVARRVTPGCSFMDYGCGSGILAIAAAKLGASPVCGVDVDPDALEAAAGNARRNGVTLSLLTASQTSATAFDFLAANILANPLRVLAPALAGLVRPAGRIALSGILETQAGELSLVYQPWFDMREFAAHDGWICLEGRRR